MRFFRCLFIILYTHIQDAMSGSRELLLNAMVARYYVNARSATLCHTLSVSLKAKMSKKEVNIFDK